MSECTRCENAPATKKIATYHLCKPCADFIKEVLAYVVSDNSDLRTMRRWWNRIISTDTTATGDVK